MNLSPLRSPFAVLVLLASLLVPGIARAQDNPGLTVFAAARRP